MKAKFLSISTILLIVINLSGQDLAFERLDQLNKGCNLSNWLEAFWLEDADYPQNEIYTYNDIAGMKAAGMGGIRLNVNFERFLGENEPYELDLNHQAMVWVDSIIAWAEEFDLMVVLVNQHGWDALNDFTYESIKPRLSALWDQLAERYQDVDPNLLIFEIMNEPPILLSRSKIRKMMIDLLAVIRSYSIEHTIILSGGNYSSGNELGNTNPIPDTNSIYTFHFYDPFWFTHQGASWTDISYPIGTAFPHPIFNGEGMMRSIFNKVANWRNNHNLPVYLGELGAINFADEEHKCNWISIMGELIDEYEMPWAYWDCKYSDGDRFGFFNGDEISLSNVRPCFAEALRLYDFGPPTFNYDKQVNEVSLYPNPSSKQISFSFDDTYFTHVKIVDVIGQNEVGMAIDFIQNSNPTIDIEHLPPGIYAVILYKYSEIIASGKFVKL